MSRVYQEISGLIDAIQRCQESGSNNWAMKHGQRLQMIVDIYLPSGSGIDDGCSINVSDSTPEKIIIQSSFHTMNSNGFYGKWIDLSVTVRASLQFGLDLKIVGQFGKDQDLKDHLDETFQYCLIQEVTV